MKFFKHISDTQSKYHIPCMMLGIIAILLVWTFVVFVDAFIGISEELPKTQENQAYLHSRIESIDMQLLEIKIDVMNLQDELSESESNLQGQIIQNKIDFDDVSHEACQVKIDELWKEIELIRKLVK